MEYLSKKDFLTFVNALASDIIQRFLVTLFRDQ
jgi:hypothetical protein